MPALRKRVVFNKLERKYYMRGGGLTSDIQKARDFRPRNTVKKFLTVHKIPDSDIIIMRRSIMPPGKLQRTVRVRDNAQVLGYDNGKVYVRR